MTTTRDQKLSAIGHQLALLRAADTSPVDIPVSHIREWLNDLGLTPADVGTSEIELIGFELVRLGIRKAYAMANKQRSGTDTAQILLGYQIEELDILRRLYDQLKSPGMPTI